MHHVVEVIHRFHLRRPTDATRRHGTLARRPRFRDALETNFSNRRLEHDELPPPIRILRERFFSVFVDGEALLDAVERVVPFFVRRMSEELRVKSDELLMERKTW